MNRRGFMMGFAGLVGAGATLGIALSPAKATPLSQLKDLEAGAELPDADILDVVAEAPDGTPIDQAQWGPPGPPRGRPPGPPPGYYRRPRRRRVCGWRRDRWGRRYRDCWYVRR